MNTRIKTIGPGVEAEALAGLTVIQWDARSNTGSIQYQSEWNYRLSGTETYFGLPESDGSLREDMQTAMSRTYMIPDVVNGGTKQMSGVDVALFLKVHFDALHNEQRAPAAPPEVP